ncbi:response regulator transcription factor [Meiothermus granaticius]|uniref:Response regulator MprA n=1 Tax=Meiothermus granaticius NBRC 107808 TaxID=1227551 RepID=A0A399F6L6_9DEIN|nr:response regulator transcription factor [Meiothermus granaticius]RIH91858.1 Response regulator MprA [Meiothermus granaticius NBRC 107808]GEM87525.1 DNA-binding response regulator [Meiothermus granaticius NBRC 107808]
MQRVLVIDDDSSVRSFLKRGLSYEGYAVDLAESGEAGLAQARIRYPDLVILDVMMPGIDGLEVLRRLRAADEKLPIIMLTARDAPEDQIHGLNTGADDYVTKPISFEVLIARVRSLLRRHQAEAPNVLRFSDLEMNAESFMVKRGGREITLTSLEFRLLQTFLENPERVTNKQLLLDKVWGTDFFGDANVVEVYVKQLRQKLEAGGEPRLIQTIRGAGYVLREQ